MHAVFHQKVIKCFQTGCANLCFCIVFSDFHVLACRIVRLSNVMIPGVGSELVPLHHSLPLNHFYEKLIVHAHECILYTKKEKGC